MVKNIYLVVGNIPMTDCKEEEMHILKAFRSREKAERFAGQLNALSVEAKNIGKRLVPTKIEQLDPEWMYEHDIEYIVLETKLEE